MALSIVQTRNYNEYLDRVAGQIGMPRSAMTADELGFLNVYFNNNITLAWNYGAWLDVSPYGEARFVGNALTYQHDVTQTAYWTALNVSTTANAILNPLDGFQTASKLLETTATGSHSVTQSFVPVPGAVYLVTTYLRPIGGRLAYVTVNDGVSSYYSYFNLPAGTVGSNSGNNLTGTPSITALANGWYLCSFSFTASTSATSAGTFTVQGASNGTTTSYAGDATKGFYIWANVLQLQSMIGIEGDSIPWIQLGENPISSFYECWRTPPLNNNYPVKQGFILDTQGARLIGTNAWNQSSLNGTTGTSVPFNNPVFIYYRIEVPTYYGATWTSAGSYTGKSATYTGDVVQFTNPTTGVINYYTCLLSTTPAQSPITNPLSWSLNVIPDVFFQYCCYKGVADWLKADGQWDKAQLAEKEADDVIDAYYDTQEREMGHVLPIQVSTHLTSRTR